MGLLNIHHAPNPHFWNKLVSPIEHTEFINGFFNDCLTNDNVDLSHNADLSSPNRNIRDYFILSEIKLTNAKAHLKLGTFQTMVNQKCGTSQNQLSKMLNN